jgi:hypothetical protein
MWIQHEAVYLCQYMDWTLGRISLSIHGLNMRQDVCQYMDWTPAARFFEMTRSFLAVSSLKFFACSFSITRQEIHAYHNFGNFACFYLITSALQDTWMTVQGLRRLVSNAAARVRSQVKSCGICGVQSGTGVGFHRLRRFPLPILVPEMSTMHVSSWTVAKGQLVTDVPSGHTITSPYETKQGIYGRQYLTWNICFFHIQLLF